MVLVQRVAHDDVNLDQAQIIAENFQIEQPQVMLILKQESNADKRHDEATETLLTNTDNVSKGSLPDEPLTLTGQASEVHTNDLFV